MMVSLKINDKTKDAKALIEFLRALDFVTISDDKKSKKEIEKGSKKAMVEKKQKSKKDIKSPKKLLS